MLKTIISLPDGTEISSGSNSVNAIKSVAITECVNSGEELTIGSACANAAEVSLITPSGNLSIEAGAEITVYRQKDGEPRSKVGVFILEKPTRPTANSLKVTGYDRVSKLDKDLTAWLSGLDGWPYTLTAFAGMVCEACGLTFKATDVPNGDFPVYQFVAASVTGRKLMQWLGEICCRFCRATPEGEIEFAWYEPTGVSIEGSGERYYLQSSLTYEEYQTEPIDAVQIRLADSADGALWPAVAEAANSYIISGNQILNSRITADTTAVLENIKNGGLGDAVYTPCRLAIPACLDIHAGNTVQITDRNGKTITAYVMTKTQSGQKDTLECTGSRRRDSSSAVNNKTEAQKAAEMQNYASAAVNGQTQADIFKKLTDDGKIQGLFMKDGQIYVNVAYLGAGVITSADGTIQIDLTDGGKGVIFNSGISTNGLVVRSDKANAPRLLSIKALPIPNGDDFFTAFDLRSATGARLAYITEVFDSESGEPIGAMSELYSQDGAATASMQARNDICTLQLTLGSSFAAITISKDATGNLVGYLSVDGIVVKEVNGLKVSWRSNGDGTYTLIGQ